MLSQRGELGLRWQVAPRVVLSLRQSVELGDRPFHLYYEDGGDSSEPIPEADVARILDLATDLTLRGWSSDAQLHELRLQLLRQGGFGSTDSGVDSRQGVPGGPQSAIMTLRETRWLTEVDGLSLTVQANYNTVSYGLGLDGLSIPLDAGRPDSFCAVAQLGYVRRLGRAELGAGAGVALYSTPALPFNPYAEEAEDPSAMLFAPTGRAWLADSIPIEQHAIQYLVSSSLLPRVDRIAADIHSRLGGGVSVVYLAPSRLHALLALDASLELGDGRPFGGAPEHPVLRPGARQYAARAGLGYIYRRWAGMDLGARYGNLGIQQRGTGSTRAVRRWNLDLNVGFNWDVID